MAIIESIFRSNEILLVVSKKINNTSGWTGKLRSTRLSSNSKSADSFFVYRDSRRDRSIGKNRPTDRHSYFLFFLSYIESSFVSQSMKDFYLLIDLLLDIDMEDVAREKTSTINSLFVVEILEDFQVNVLTKFSSLIQMMFDRNWLMEQTRSNRFVILSINRTKNQ